MSFTLEDIQRLRSNWCDTVTVGELPPEPARAMGLHVPLVYLSKRSLDHINQRHRHVSDFDLLLAPFVFRHGLVIREQAKPNSYLCSYVGPLVPEQRRYGAVLKVASPDREVYLDTFHRLHKRQTVAWLKRGSIIRTHD
jgi:hypothetical protein